VVALDPKTGDIIALASTPGFDPNDFVRGLSVAQYGAAIEQHRCTAAQSSLAGRYPPGHGEALYALAAQHYGILFRNRSSTARASYLPGSSNNFATTRFMDPWICGTRYPSRATSISIGLPTRWASIACMSS